MKKLMSFLTAVVVLTLSLNLPTLHKVLTISIECRMRRQCKQYLKTY